MIVLWWKALFFKRRPGPFYGFFSVLKNAKKLHKMAYWIEYHGKFAISFYLLSKTACRLVQHICFKHRYLVNQNTYLYIKSI